MEEDEVRVLSRTFGPNRGGWMFDTFWCMVRDSAAECPPQIEEPDFLHEALQRLIFNFLMEYEHAALIELEMDTTHRKTNPALLKVIGKPVSKNLT